MEDIAPIYGLFLGSSPLFITAIIGIAVAGAQWFVARKTSTLVLVACVLQLLALVANALMYGWYVPHASQEGGYGSIRLLLMVWGVATSLLHAVVMGLLIWGAFAGRKPQPAAGG